MNFANLEAAVKFGREQERAAFEQKIDENPLESTHHLVYSDWLEEQGEHEEAAFRRSMGEWAQKTASYANLSRGLWTHREDLPKGVNPLHLTVREFGYDHNDPTVAYRFVGGCQWPTYRGFEEAARRSFKAGLKTRD